MAGYKESERESLISEVRSMGDDQPALLNWLVREHNFPVEEPSKQEDSRHRRPDWRGADSRPFSNVAAGSRLLQRQSTEEELESCSKRRRLAEERAAAAQAEYQARCLEEKVKGSFQPQKRLRAHLLP